MNIDTLLARYPLITDQINHKELRIILSQLELALKEAKGSVVEFGCYTGTTSLFIQRLLVAGDVKREFHVYDSFEGLPAKSEADKSPAGEQFTAGKLKASKQEFVRQFKKASLPLPIIHKGWFDTLSAADVPSQVAFAFLDGDYYNSIKTSLALVAEKLTPGARIVVDDYMSEALPGAKKAVDEWCNSRGLTPQAVASLAVIKTAI